MNRFDNVSVSAYTPQSMQELAFTPMIKRAKHDEMSKNLAELSAIATDPLNEHRDEALQLKNNLESKLGNLSGDLANKGIDSIGISDFYKLQKEKNDLIAPTGRIGQINASKIDYNKQKEEFIKSSEKENIGRNRALQLWNEKTKDYSGYDNKHNIVNVTPQGVSQYQDYEKYKQVAKSLMGEVEFESRNGGYKLKDSGLGNGTKVMVDSKGFQKKSTNLDALNNAILAGNEMWLKPTGEGYKYNQDAGVDQNNFRQRFIGDFGSMLKTSKGSGYEENGSFINDASGPNAGKEKTPMFNDAIQDPNSIKNLNKETGEIDFKQIGTLRDERKIVGYDTTTNQPVYGGSTKVQSTYKNTLTPIHQKFYETAAKRLIASGKLPKNADLNSTTNAEKIGFYMKNHMKFPTIASDIIRADVAIDNKLFSGNLASKDQGSRNRTLTQDVRQTEKGPSFRTMIDVENGGKVKLEEGDTIDYLGVESPINYSSYGFENKFEQSVMGHRAQVLDSKGNVKANVVISRTRNEMNDPTFKKMYEINQSYKSGLNNLGDWVRPSGKYSGSKELSKARIKVNDDNTFQIKMNGYEESPRMDNAQFIQQMQSIMEH